MRVVESAQARSQVPWALHLTSCVRLDKGTGFSELCFLYLINGYYKTCLVGLQPLGEELIFIEMYNEALC